MVYCIPHATSNSTMASFSLAFPLPPGRSPLPAPPHSDHAEAQFARHHATAAKNCKKSAALAGPASNAPIAQQNDATNCSEREIRSPVSADIFRKHTPLFSLQFQKNNLSCFGT